MISLSAVRNTLAPLFCCARSQDSAEPIQPIPAALQEVTNVSGDPQPSSQFRKGSFIERRIWAFNPNGEEEWDLHCKTEEEYKLAMTKVEMTIALDLKGVIKL